MPEASTPPGAGAVPPRTAASRRWLVLLLVSLAFFMVELDITIVNVALPTIEEELGFARADLPWVINSYLLFFGGFLLLAGRLADLFGRKPLFMTGLALFGLGSAVNAVAPSPVALVLGRALQGLGGAVLAPTGLATLTTTFTEPRERTRALAVWSFILTGSVAIGLTLGGVLTDAWSWRWIFAINLPVAALGLVAAPRLLPRVPGDAGPRTLDLPGVVAVVAGPAVLVYALANAPAWGWGSARTVGLLVAGALILATLGVVERASRAPLVRPGIFRIRSLTVANLSFLLLSCGLFGMFYFSSLYVQQVLGYRPLPAGLALLPLAAGVIGGVTSAQQLIPRLGARAVAAGGLVIGAAGGALLARVPAAGGYAWPLLPGMLVLALGVGAAMVTLTLLATSGVPEPEAGLASGLFTAVSYLGGALGLATLSTVATARTANVLADTPGAGAAALVEGFRAAYLVSALLLGAAALLIVLLLRRHHLTAVDQPGTGSH